MEFGCTLQMRYAQRCRNTHSNRFERLRERWLAVLPETITRSHLHFVFVPRLFGDDLKSVTEAQPNAAWQGP